MDQLLFLLNKRHTSSAPAANHLTDMEDLGFDVESSTSPIKQGIRLSRETIREGNFRGDTSVLHENPGNITTTTIGSSRQQRRSGVPSKLDSSLLANTGRTRHNRSPPSYKYVSPFVIQANLKAKQRSKQAVSQLRSQKENYRDGRMTKKMNELEWTMDTKSAGLFDPKLKKKEIFRIEPKNQKNKENKGPLSLGRNRQDRSRNVFDVGNNELDDGLALKPTTLDRNKLTMHPKLDTSPSLAMRLQNMRKSSSMSSTSSDVATSPLRRSVESVRSWGNGSTSSGNISTGSRTPPLASSPRSSMSAKKLWDQKYKKINSGTGIIMGEEVEVVSRSTSPIDERVVELLIHGIEDDYDNNNFHEVMRPYSAPVRDLHRPFNSQTQAQAQGQVDMMASMARLMDAVGTIVSGAASAVQTSSSSSSLSNSPRKYNSPRFRIAPNKLLAAQEAAVSSLSSPTEPSSLTGGVQATSTNAVDTLLCEISKHRELSADRKLRSNRYVTQNAWPDELKSPTSVAAIATERTTSATATKTMKDTVPLTKTAVMDLMVSKLQAAEKHEQDTRLLLEKTRKNYHRSANANEHARDLVTTESSQDTNGHRYENDGSLSNIPSVSATRLPRTPTHAHVPPSTSTSTSTSSPTRFNSEILTIDGPPEMPIESLLPSTTINTTISMWDSTNQQQQHQHQYATAMVSEEGLAVAAPELLVILDKRLTKESRAASTAEHDRRLAREKANASLLRYPALTADRSLVLSVMQYKQQLQEATRLRSAAFLSRGVGLSDVVKTVSESMIEHALQQVAEEVEGFVSEMADHLISKV